MDYYGPDGLYAVTVPYVPRALCKLAYATRNKIIDDSMICAGVSGKDSCQVSAGHVNTPCICLSYVEYILPAVIVAKLPSNEIYKRNAF